MIYIAPISKIESEVIIIIIIATWGHLSCQSFILGLIMRPAPASHCTLAYETLGELDNPRLSYRNSTVFNIATVHNLKSE